MTAIRILIAEDDTALRSSLAFVLKNRGYEALEAEDGMVALELAQQAKAEDRPIDMLITDIRMPNVDGVELLKLLTEADMELPTVVISGHGDRDMLIDLLRLGCDNFLSKPFEPDEILDKVAEVLRKLELQQRYQERATAEIKNVATRLDQDAKAYRRDLEHLKKEVDDAVCTYRDLIDVCKSDLVVNMELRNRTLRDLGGDFAGTCCHEGVCDILVADVAGHDLAASYQTIMIKSFFDENCRTRLDGEAFFRLLNEELLENGHNERMITAQFLRLDLAVGTGQIVSAGHPRMVRLQAGLPTSTPMSVTGDILGLRREISLETREFHIAPGDRFFLYTDGVTGASHIDGPTGTRRVLSGDGLDDLIEVFGHLDLPGQVEAVWRYALNFCRGKLTDDMLFMGVEIPEA